MDEHLNIFYPYSLKENDVIKEDNITRAAMISFNDMKQNEKISFINKLVNKTILLNDNYRFEVELQPTTNINEPCIKFLVVFFQMAKSVIMIPLMMVWMQFLMPLQNIMLGQMAK